MSIVAAELLGFQSANMPEGDATTSGGAIATAGKIELTDPAAAEILKVKSDGADTRTLTITGRLASGVIDTDALVLNGVTVVTGAKTFERVLKAVLSASDATRMVSLLRNDGTTVLATLGPNVTSQRRLFYDSTSENAIAIRYEKAFYKNSNATLTLTSAAIKLTSDPAARYRIAGATAVDDSGSVANRKTAPGGVTFVDDNVSQSVPGDALAAGSAIGVWVEQNLPANDPAHKNSVSIELSGATT